MTKEQSTAVRFIELDADITRLRDLTITQAFVAGQMDAQYTAAVLRQDVTASSPLKFLKAKSYGLALENMTSLIEAAYQMGRLDRT